MLQSISIQNYALITKLDIEFSDGFSVITGETGSGKSILLGALSLVLGQRAEVNVLKDKEQKCIIESSFSIERYQLEKFFADNELDYEKETLLRREILPNGKSRAFVNDSPVSVKILKELGLRLIDVHSQNQNLVIGSFEYQVGIVDTYAGNSEILKKYQECFDKFQKLKQELRKQEELAAKEKADLDYFQFQLEQLLEAKLVAGEQVEMEAELETLTHAEEIKSGLVKAYENLSEGEFPIVTQLKEARNAVAQIKNVFPDAESFFERLESAYIELNDLAQELDRSNESVELDPSRIEFLNQKLDAIYSLQQKHHVNSGEELIQIREELIQKVDKIVSGDDFIEDLKKQLKAQEELVLKSAKKLTDSRVKVIPAIEKTIVSQLVQLGIPNANFKVSTQIKEDFQYLGCDYLSFLFSANKNGQLEEVQRVASGGELSRLMLSIKYLISSSTALPSIVFDEIDTGVSGEIAAKMGTMMNKMAENIQVISITHLPQIAGKGKNHYKVYKADDELETYSNIVLLDQQSRIEELAKMLSGADLTQAALDNAKVLLSN
ncbi:DNA repair protein RecN [Labilibaculum manganireducens]|uniref:DNA repair protein RecN n=1 Tax=Labilibaculum manganireducens TaxID=1940525 RepID=A0A2N3I2L5_9BACT|nr:DNA repair protein RecN [Labilibaculum manganireducens]PKQ64560.1 DNA repair protein RecN [Labilibaculum manganireducens]